MLSSRPFTGISPNFSNTMAAIKDRTANAARNGHDIDWSRYEESSTWRPKLENMLKAAR